MKKWHVQVNSNQLNPNLNCHLPFLCSIDLNGHKGRHITCVRLQGLDSTTCSPCSINCKTFARFTPFRNQRRDACGSPQTHTACARYCTRARPLQNVPRSCARNQSQHKIVNPHILAGFLYLESYFETPRHILKDAGPYVCICK